jgi:ABC-2 type transport system ATP-binding protein
MGKEMVKVTIEDGDKNTIYKALQELDSVDMVDILSQSSNTFEVYSKPEQSSRKDIFKLCVDNLWSLTELTPTETKLEDIFRELTSN